MLISVCVQAIAKMSSSAQSMMRKSQDLIDRPLILLEQQLMNEKVSRFAVLFCLTFRLPRGDST